MNATTLYTQCNYGIQTSWAKKLGRRDERINSVPVSEWGIRYQNPRRRNTQKKT
jgi:hypothetical protein